MTPETEVSLHDQSQDQNNRSSPQPTKDEKTGAIIWETTSFDKGLSEAWNHHAQFPFDYWNQSPMKSIERKK